MPNLALRTLWDLPVTWLLMPLKLSVIILLGAFQQFRNVIFPKHPKFWAKEFYPTADASLISFAQKLFIDSPVYDHAALGTLYALRIPVGQEPDGSNHNWDHLAARQGVFISCLTKHGINPLNAARALQKCVAYNTQGSHELRRGWKLVRPNQDLVTLSTQPVSGDMLVGFCFGFLHAPEELLMPMSLIGSSMFRNRGLTTEGQVSSVGNFLPGIQFKNSETPIPVGAQTATYLCGLKSAIEAFRVFEHMAKMPYPAKRLLQIEYWKRLILYGGFLEVMFPTAGIFFKRGYNNDNVTMQALWCLHHLSTTRFERTVYKIGMFWVWALSWPWLNGFFSGLLRDATKGQFPSKKYMERCQNYAMHCSSQAHDTAIRSSEWADYWPIDIQDRNLGEFSPDEDQEKKHQGDPQFRSTLGNLANLLWSRS